MLPCSMPLATAKIGSRSSLLSEALPWSVVEAILGGKAASALHGEALFLGAAGLLALPTRHFPAQGHGMPCPYRSPTMRTCTGA